MLFLKRKPDNQESRSPEEAIPTPRLRLSEAAMCLKPHFFAGRPPPPVLHSMLCFHEPKPRVAARGPLRLAG